MGKCIEERDLSWRGIMRSGGGRRGQTDPHESPCFNKPKNQEEKRCRVTSAKKTAPAKANGKITSVEQSGRAAHGLDHFPSLTEPKWLFTAHSNHHSRQGEPTAAGNAVTHQKQFLNINFSS